MKEAERSADLILSKWSVAAIAEDVRASLRVHIAAALREAQEETGLARIHELYNEIEQLKAERDSIEAELSRMTESCDNWRASCKQVENERDAAFVRGLRRAKEACECVEFVASADEAIDGCLNAIQAEIEKAGK